MTDKKADRRFRWNERSIAWYERAIEYTGYNQLLWRFLQPYFSSGDTVCEIACGTGSLARTIAPHVARYTANDMDPYALSYLKEQLEKGPSQKSITIREGDWRTVLSGFRFDTLLFQQFSAFRTDWEILQQMAARQILAILPSAADTYRGPAVSSLSVPESKEAAGLDSAEAHCELPVTANKPQRETWQDALAFLQEKHIPCESVSFEVDFGQPFDSMEDALSYCHHYYGQHITREEAEEWAKALQPADCGFYLPKQKRLGIVIAHL